MKNFTFLGRTPAGLNPLCCFRDPSGSLYARFPRILAARWAGHRIANAGRTHFAAVVEGSTDHRESAVVSEEALLP